jgi:hypothetical protein
MAFEHLIFLEIPVAPNVLVSELVDSIIGKGDMSVKNIEIELEHWEGKCTWVKRQTCNPRYRI